MTLSNRARLVTALVLGAMWVGMIAAPATAAVRTRWVDNDSKAGDGPAACDTAHFHSIQAAINASSAFDTVYVCPGTYTEQLTIDVRGLRVQAKPTRTAKILPPAVLNEVDFTTALVRITARDVDFIGFRLRFAGGDLPVVPTVAPPCSQVDAAIVADAPHAQIYSNAITATGDYTLSGECGYIFGIILGSTEVAGLQQGIPAPVAYGPDTSYVGGNNVRDFKFGGIGVIGNRSARVYENKIRYVHANDPATCLLTPVLGFKANLMFPCIPDVELPPPATELPFSVGIGVAGALADLRKNSVYSTFDPDLCYALGEDCPLGIAVGIGMLDPAPGSRARNNVITNAAFGFGLINGFITTAAPSALPPAPDGVQVTGNRVNEGFIGFAVLGSNNVFYGNRAHLNLLGVYSLDGGDNTFDSNDFRYNLEMDCIDETSGLGTLGTANDWDAVNLGDPDSSSPIGLCGLPIF